MSGHFEFEISESLPGIRLDTWLHQRLPQISRSTIARLIELQAITVNHRPTKARYTPKLRDHIVVEIPEPKNSDILPEAIPLDILFEDEHLVVLNKAPGICVHPSAGHPSGTLVNALLHHCQGQLSGIGGVSRPGIVHRLDQDTSGCLVVAKNDLTHQGLAEQFADRSTHKTYLTVTCGSVRPKEGEINANIARHPSHRKRMAVSDGSGRAARTSYQLKEDFSEASLVEATLHTGRTHQIRVHFKHLGFPILGDQTYGLRQTKALAQKLAFTPARQLLHAFRLQFVHPRTNEQIEAEAPIPRDFEQALERLRAANKSRDR